MPQRHAQHVGLVDLPGAIEFGPANEVFYAGVVVSVRRLAQPAPDAALKPQAETSPAVRGVLSG